MFDRRVLFRAICIDAAFVFLGSTLAPVMPSSAETSDRTAIEMSTLPSPPTTIGKNIDHGNVRFVTGGTPPATPDSFPQGGRVAGETQFHFRYRYESHARWRVLTRRDSAQRDSASRSSEGSDPMVQVSVTFRNLQWDVDHEVWLRKPPGAERFWSDPIVLHELDHVRISSAPQIESVFLDAIRPIRSFRVALSEVAVNGKVDATKVQDLIALKMKRAMERTTEYVRVRYRELDRMTDHGLRPLPAVAEADLIESP